MPIISANGKTFYSRYDQAPRQEKTKRETKPTSPATFADSDDNSFSTPSKIDLMALMKESGFFLILVVLISWALQSRQHGLFSTNNSVMSGQEAATYVNYITLSSNEAFSSPVRQSIDDQISSNSDDDQMTASTIDSIPKHYRQGPCGDDRNRVFEGGKVFVSYKLITHEQNQIILSTDTPVDFIVKSSHDAIHTGSTLPLLHHLALGLCKGETRSFEFTQELFDRTTNQQKDGEFNPNSNQFLTTLFPTLSTTTVNEQKQKTRTSTITLPFTFTVTINDVESSETLKLKFLEEEKIKLQHGDISAFFRAILGKIHPIFILFAYVGIRFGSLYYKRMRISSLKKKHPQEALSGEEVGAVSVTDPPIQSSC